MDISVIICTHNRSYDLHQTLCSLSAVDVPTDLRTEVIVVDNASTDDTRRVVEGFQVPNLPLRYLYESRRGKSNALNLAISQAHGEVLLFTDDDVRFNRDWIKDMSSPIFDGAVDAVAGGVLMAPYLVRPWMQPMHRAWLADTSGDNAYLGSLLVGANMAFSRRVLERVPEFDPALGPGALGFGEESLFSRQLTAAGFTVIPRRDITVEHHFQENRLYRESFLDTARKHGMTAAYVMYHWEHVSIQCVRVHMARKRLQIALWNKISRIKGINREGVSPKEMHHARSFHLYSLWATFLGKPRLYEKNGFVRDQSRNG